MSQLSRKWANICMIGVLIPFWTSLAFRVVNNTETTTSLPVADSVITLLSITIIPIILGMIFRHLKKDIANKLEGPVKRITGIYLVILIGGLLYKERVHFSTYMLLLGPAMATLNIATMAFGGISARLMKLSRADTITLILETGIQMM